MAIYNYELSALQIHDHYRAFVPAVVGSTAFVRNIGTVTSQSSSTYVGITVPSGGVPAGHTLIVTVMSDYTAVAPTIVDIYDNVYTVIQSSSDPGDTFRLTLFSAPINGALAAGDKIFVKFGVAVINKVVSINAFSGIAFSGSLDTKNTFHDVSSTPGNIVPITTTQADDLLLAIVAVPGPLSETYTEDLPAEWVGLPRLGTTAASPEDFTLNAAWRSVASTGTYKYMPTLGTSQEWVEVVAALNAGASAATPPAVPTASFVRNIGTATSKISSFGLVLTVPAGGIAAGQTLVVSVVHDYTARADDHGFTREHLYTRWHSARQLEHDARFAVLDCCRCESASR